MRLLVRAAAGLWLLLSPAACAPCDERPGTVEPRAPVERVAEEPARPPPSIRPTVTAEPLPDGGTYRLHRFALPLADVRFEIVDLELERPLEAFARDDGDILLAFNGGYWDPDLQPEGLTVVDGEVLVPFDPDLGGGVLVVDGERARLLDAEVEGFEAPVGVRFAQQARPRLVVDGANNIARDTGLRADRTALCIREDGAVELVAARTDHPRGRAGPTLFALADRLVSLGCSQALNLDGGPSSGVVWRQDGELRALPPRTDIRLAIVVRSARQMDSTHMGTDPF